MAMVLALEVSLVLLDYNRCKRSEKGALGHTVCAARLSEGRKGLTEMIEYEGLMLDLHEWEDS